MAGLSAYFKGGVSEAFPAAPEGGQRISEEIRAFRWFRPGFGRDYSGKRILNGQGSQLKPRLEVLGE